MKPSWLAPALWSLAALTACAVLRTIHFAYFYRPFAVETTCADLPPGSTVLALGFEHLGETGGKILPGGGNLAIARTLAGCAGRLSLVVTQKAISDAMEQGGLLQNGLLLGRVPVRQMHPHDPAHPVRTLQALHLALKGIDPLPTTLVLVAHDKQIDRAFLDLQSLYPGRIIIWKRNNLPYASPGWLPPLRWAARELHLARPVESVIRIQMLNRRK